MSPVHLFSSCNFLEITSLISHFAHISSIINFNESQKPSNFVQISSFSNHNLLSINATMPIYTYYIRSRIIKSVKYCAYIMVYMYNISHPIIRIFAHQDMHAKDGYNLRVFSFSNRLISELSIYEKSTVTEDLSPCGGAAACFVFLMNDECCSCQLVILFFFSSSLPCQGLQDL